MPKFRVLYRVSWRERFEIDAQTPEEAAEHAIVYGFDLGKSEGDGAEPLAVYQDGKEVLNIQKHAQRIAAGDVLASCKEMETELDWIIQDMQASIDSGMDEDDGNLSRLRAVAARAAAAIQKVTNAE